MEAANFKISLKDKLTSKEVLLSGRNYFPL